MDYTVAPEKKRPSFVRRLIPWTVTLGLFAGGGWGVYQYVAGRNASANPAPDAAKMDAASSRVLAALPNRSPSGWQSAPSLGDDSDRYGATPQLPPAAGDDEVATPRSAAAVEAPNNPFATTPLGGYGGRYGAPTATPGQEKTSVPASTDGAAATIHHDETVHVTAAVDADVARGQEPQTENPLRGGSRSTPAVDRKDEATEARTAFGSEGLPPAQLTIPNRASASGQSATGAGGGTELTAVESGRYPAGFGTGATAAMPSEPAAATAGQATPLATANPYVPAATPYGTQHSTAPAQSPYAASASSTAPTQMGYAAAPLSRQAATSAASPQYGSDVYGSAADASVTPTPGLGSTGADGTGRPGEKILEGAQSPAIVIQKLAPPEIQVGKRATFAIRVQNNGQRAAHEVQVIDEVPLGTQLLGTAPKANTSGSRVVWNLGTLSAGEERIVEMELMPTEEGELGSVATVQYMTQASAKTRCTRPQLALRLTSNPTVMIGAQQIVQIEVSNPGSGDATGVMLLENIPQGVTHEAGPALEFEIGTLKAGDSKKIDLVLQADAAGKINNIMTARGDANLQVQSNCQFEIIAPELKVSVEGPSKRMLERPATYTISVNNPGTASAREVQLVTQLPKGMKYVSANNMGEYDPATHSVYWSLKELPANESGKVELTALAVEAGDQALQVATRAQQGLEDRTEAHVMVEGIVALSFDVHDVQDAIEVGGETAYEIRVTNQGSKVATNVQVMAQMPAGLRAKAGQGDARYAIQGDRVVFAPVAQLAPKAEATFKFGVQGLRPGDQRVKLQVTTDEVRDPITEVESTQVYADE